MDLGPPVVTVIEESSLAKYDGVSTSPPFALTTLVLVRFQKVRAVLDLGQAIGKSTFEINDINVRLRWIPNESKQLSIGIGGLEVSSTGRASGLVKVGGLLFETRLRDNNNETGIRSSDLVCNSMISRSTDTNFPSPF